MESNVSMVQIVTYSASLGDRHNHRVQNFVRGSFAGTTVAGLKDVSAPVGNLFIINIIDNRIELW